MNAKELALSKLNAGTKMLGMYVYGLSIGMEFEDIADILMSTVGNVIKNMLDDDKFSGRDAFGTVNESLFKYFTDGPFKLLFNYDISYDSQDNLLSKSPMKALLKFLSDKLGLKDKKTGEAMGLSEMLVEIAKKDWTLVLKIKIFEELRNTYSGRLNNDIRTSKEAVEIYNLLINFIEDYILQSDVIWKNQKTFESVLKLSNGASEMKTLGLVLSLNLGIKTTSSDFLTQINNLRRAIYNKTNDLEDIVDLTKFALDDNPYIRNGVEYSTYRDYVISKYETVKEAFNIFDVVTKVPHFMGYLQTLVIANVEVNNVFTFRSSDNLLIGVKDKLGDKFAKEDGIIRGILNFCSDWLMRKWMTDTGKLIVIPKGNQAFDRNYNLYKLTEDTIIQLGTPWGNATFRIWMENEVIPNLKNGIIQPGILPSGWPKISNNKFIKDLGNDLLTRTVSRNPTVIYTLPINMLPSTDLERSTFNLYKSLFNDLTDKYSYNWTHYTTNPDGTVLEVTEPIPNPLSIRDLFTYYAMIANSWKLDQASLVSITEDLQNQGIIKEMHDYITEVDKSGFTLSLDNIIWEDLLPYVALSASPYSGKADMIWARNPRTLKRVLMENIGLKAAAQARENKETNVFGNYRARPSIDNLNYFVTNSKDTGEYIISTKVNYGGNDIDLKIRFDFATGKINRIEAKLSEINDEKYNKLVEKLKEFPMKKVDKFKQPDMSMLLILINHILNEC